jgi:hypothetical protein
MAGRAGKVYYVRSRLHDRFSHDETVRLIELIDKTILAPSITGLAENLLPNPIRLINAASALSKVRQG